MSQKVDNFTYLTAEGQDLTNAGGGPFALWAFKFLSYLLKIEDLLPKIENKSHFHRM